jgi:hypothetical protein
MPSGEIANRVFIGYSIILQRRDLQHFTLVDLHLLVSNRDFTPTYNDCEWDQA